MEGSPLFFARGGYIYDSLFLESGSRGSYWSSTVLSSTGAYSLKMETGGGSGSEGVARFIGRSVRCVAR